MMMSQQGHSLCGHDEDGSTFEDEVAARARDGDVDALMIWRELLEPVDYEELGWSG